MRTLVKTWQVRGYLLTTWSIEKRIDDEGELARVLRGELEEIASRRGIIVFLESPVVTADFDSPQAFSPTL